MRKVWILYIFQRIRQIPEIDGLSKETVTTSWLAKYDAITKGNIHIKIILTFPISVLQIKLKYDSWFGFKRSKLV